MKTIDKPLDCPIPELLINIPENVYVLYNSLTKKHACYRYNRIDGLAAFVSKSNAVLFSKGLPEISLEIQEVNFDEAKNIAISKPEFIVAILILDELSNPDIFYIR